MEGGVLAPCNSRSHGRATVHQSTREKNCVEASFITAIIRMAAAAAAAASLSRI
jgi:hypothetical protein